MAAFDVSTSSRLPPKKATQETQHNERRSSFSHKEEGAAAPRSTPASPSDDDNYLFSCRCDSAKAVSALLSCLTIHTTHKNNNMQPVTVFCTPTALTFHVYGTTARQSQASVDMHKGLFCSYQAMEGEFCVNLTSVLDCLHVLGSNLERTKLCWAYHPNTQVFEMELLEEGGVLSTAAIPGLLPPTPPSESLALAFSQSPIASRVLLKSEWLRYAWSELEYVPGSTTCTVAVSAQSLQLATVGHVGECVVSLAATPSNQNTCLLSLEVGKSIPRTYPFSSFRLGMRALDIAEETCLTINEMGMMAIQHQVLDQEGQANFVDFIMTCLQDDDEVSQQEQDEAPMSLGWKTTQERHDDQDEDDSDDEHRLPPISATPLFGTVVPAADTSSTRSVRRRRRPRSRNAPASDSEEEEEEDVTAPVTPPRRGNRAREQQVSSSPELVYGEEE